LAARVALTGQPGRRKKGAPDDGEKAQRAHRESDRRGNGLLNEAITFNLLYFTEAVGRRVERERERERERDRE
jgi:hypothetical protein